MKIQVLQQVVGEYVTQLAQIVTADHAALANMLFHQCVHAPYYQNSYTDIVLFHDSPNPQSVQVAQCTRDSLDTPQLRAGIYWDPLKELYDDFGNFDEDRISILFPTAEFKQKALAFDQLPAAIKNDVQTHLSVLHNNPQIHRLFYPSPKDITARNTFVGQWATEGSVNDIITEIHGGHEDINLVSSGILCHNKPSHNSSRWHYFVLHNNDEVVGVAGAVRENNNPVLTLSYLSVAPGFRRQGVSAVLLDNVLEFVHHQQWILAGSSHAKMTQDNPYIAHAWDRQISAHTVPFVPQPLSFVEDHCVALRAQMDWDEFCAVFKPLSNQWLAAHPSVGCSSECNRAEIIAQVQAVKPARRPKI